MLAHYQRVLTFLFKYASLKMDVVCHLAYIRTLEVSFLKEEVMKTLTGVLCFLVFGVFGVAYAGSEVKIEGGKILVSPSVWTATGVKVSKEAEKYPNAVLEAFRSPGKVITVEKKVSHTVVGLFHYREDITATLGVRYDAAKAVVDVERMDKTVERVGHSFLLYPIFWLIAVVAFSVFVFGKRKKGTGATAAVAATVAALAFVTVFNINTTTTATFAIAFGVGFATFFAASVAAFAAHGGMNGGMKAKVYGMCFYIPMILSAGMLYYPLFF